MMNKIYKKALLLSFLFLPCLAFAQVLGKTGRILGEAKNIITNILIPLAFTLSLLFFFWGVAKYIWGQGQGKDDGKKIMLWGVIALFVISSIWGLVYFLRDELDIGDDYSAPIPTIGGSGGSNEQYWNQMSP